MYSAWGSNPTRWIYGRSHRVKWNETHIMKPSARDPEGSVQIYLKENCAHRKSQGKSHSTWHPLPSDQISTHQKFKQVNGKRKCMIIKENALLFVYKASNSIVVVCNKYYCQARVEEFNLLNLPQHQYTPERLIFELFQKHPPSLQTYNTDRERYLPAFVGLQLSYRLQM